MNNHEYAIELLENVKNRANAMKVPTTYGSKFLDGVNTGLEFITAYIDYCIHFEKMKGGE